MFFTVSCWWWSFPTQWWNLGIWLRTRCMVRILNTFQKCLWSKQRIICMLSHLKNFFFLHILSLFLWNDFPVMSHLSEHLPWAFCCFAIVKCVMWVVYPHFFLLFLKASVPHDRGSPSLYVWDLRLLPEWTHVRIWRLWWQWTDQSGETDNWCSTQFMTPSLWFTSHKLHVF